MELWDRISLFTPLDAVAMVAWYLIWLGVGLAIERGLFGHASVSMLMKDMRRDWMREMVTRVPRMFDAQILATLRHGTTFFASASMIAIGGGLALIGNTERLLGVARDLTLDSAPAVVWEVKLLAVLLIVTNAFLKFVWSHRLFGYCAVVMAAVPNDVENPQAHPRAQLAAELSNSAARSFNRGMRSLYFALAGLAWLLGPVPLMLATGATVLMLWRREFGSMSRQALLERTPL